jgi:hypothetical protein
MSRKLKTLLKELENGYTPHELDYSENCKVKIEWEKFIYNDWADIDYWLARMPDGLLDQFPCLTDWAIEEAEKNTHKTPLQELEERKNENINIITEKIKILSIDINDPGENTKTESDDNL